MKALVALGSVDWEAKLLGIMSHPMLGITVQRRCLDAVDARSAMQVHDADVLLVSDATLRVDRDLVSDAGLHGVVVVALSGDTTRWLDVGVTEVIAIDVTDLSATVREIVSRVQHADATPTAVLDPQGRGVLVAGWGGGAGRSTCVRELSYALTMAHDSAAVLMADADTYGPSLAQEIGIEDSSSGLLTACRAFENRELTATSLGLHIVDVQRNLALLPGLPRASRWTDVRVPALRGVWDVARTAFDVVVADGGPVLDFDPAISIEHTLPKRHAAVLTALDAAETVVLCARADSVGIARLIRGYIDSDGLLDDKRIVVVLAGTHNRAHRKDVELAVTRHTGLPVVVSVPSVPEVMHRALVHTTFASLIDKDVARAFADTAQSVMPHSPGLAPLRLSALPDHPSVAGPEAQRKAEPRSMSRRNARTASNKVTTAAIDDYLGGNVA